MNEYKTAFTTLQLITHFFIELAVSMILGYFIGKAIDTYFFEDKHIFVIIFIFLGLISSFVNMFRKAMKLAGGKKDANQKSKHD